jgi:hypothetical protein
MKKEFNPQAKQDEPYKMQTPVYENKAEGVATGLTHIRQ